jgi:hypothetical protein
LLVIDYLVLPVLKLQWLFILGALALGQDQSQLLQNVES